MDANEATDPYVSKVESVERDLRSLQDDLALTSVNDALADIDTALRDLPGAIQQVRSRGYVFKNYLEKKTEVLAQQWSDMRWRVTAAVDEQSRLLRFPADQLQQRLVQLRSNRNEGEAAALAAEVADLQSRVRAAQSTIENTYGPLKQNVDQTAAQVKDVARVLDQVDGAVFKLYPGEGVVAAVKAQWMTSEKEGPRGILFLTEDRLLFEQREEVATKKVLFVTTAKQKVQDLKWEAAVGQLERVGASELGGAFLGIGKKEMLELAFEGSAKIRSAQVHLEADSEAWQALIGRVKSGDIAGERMAPKDQAAVQAARAAPTKCPTCGATITQPVVRGMSVLKCEYCGAAIRL